MENNNLQDMRILGAGSISEGEYNNIKIAGSCDILGNIKANSVSGSGSMFFRGNIEVENIKSSGSFTCQGSVISKGEIKTSGSAEFNNNVEGKEIIINGGSKIDGNITFEKMITRGSCYIKGDCEGEDFSNLGEISVEGLLAADKIFIVPEGNSHIREIGGAEINVKAEKKKKIMFFNITIGSEGKLKCNIIEGDKIHLENTKCKIVRGENITIGKGCNIERIEYTGELNIENEKSTVGEKVCMKI